MQSRHPKALWILFLTETCERYGFYAIQSIIALYLTLQLGLPDATTYAIGGAFTALTYISPLMGGWIADRYIGQKNAILLGALVLSGSYLGLACSSLLQGILFSLAMVSVGTGLLKPNISSILGRQYEENDPRRNTGFTVFYMGINLGIFMGTTIPIQIQRWYGWHYSFYSASAALLTAVAIFLIGRCMISMPDYLDHKRENKIKDYLKTLAIFLGMLAIANLLLNHTEIASGFFILLSLICVAYVLWNALIESKLQRLNTITFLLLCFISVIFWASYFQIFLVLTLFIERCVEPIKILGVVLAPPHYVAIQSIGIMVFGYMLQKLWARRPDKHFALGVCIKFSLSILLMLFAYLLIVLAIGDAHTATKVSPFPVMAAYLLISLAELMLSPIGLSAVTRLVRPQVVSTMMGIFFVTLGVGAYLSGKLGGLATVSKDIHSLALIKEIYHQAFIDYVAMLAGASIFAMVITLCVYMMYQRYGR